MAKLSFTVELDFQDKINSDEEVLEVATNIANAIRNEAENYGIAPDNSDTFLKTIKVTGKNTEKEVIQKLY